MKGQIKCDISTKQSGVQLPKRRKLHTTSVQSLSRGQLFATPWTAARQASLSIANSQSSLRLTSIESVMPSSRLILCRLLLLPSIFPSIRSGSFQMSQLLASGGLSIGSFSFSICPSNEHPKLIFRTDWLDLLAVQGTQEASPNTTVQKHQCFSAQLSSQSNSHIHTWPLEKP